MAKQFDYLYETLLSFEYLHKAFKKAAKGKRGNAAVASFVLASKIQNMSFGLQEALVAASYYERPAAQLRKADMRLSALRLYIRLAHDLTLLSVKQYAHVSKILDEIGRLLGGWMKQQKIKL